MEMENGEEEETKLYEYRINVIDELNESQNNQ